ncbi:MAG: phenylalanine--tRNA ligase subunit beta [Spirochaetia bacterium]|nr:phenylalanine--tRNA ligase subunit beta [Spirochaetia bacterium]
MKLSFNWLNEFIDLSDVKIGELADLLTMKTCEVEEYSELRPDLENFIVAEVRNVEKHPDADKLRVCQVFDGANTLQIVTGAPNVASGKKYPLAPLGVVMPGGLEIKPAKLRGVDSNGMLCSSSELDLENFIFTLGEKEDGLLALPDSMITGSAIRNAFCLDDFILEIDNKSITHRPDLWSHFGFAREIASLTGKSLKPALKSTIKEDPSVDDRSKKVTCKIESLKKGDVTSHAAIAYSWANLENIVIKPSEIKTQARLIAAGMRPINNVVDVSNYVMLEMGQPNHAFDRSKISENIGIKFAKGNERLRLIDKREILIPAGIVLITDNDRPVALAGVMGGEDTEVSGLTTSLFLESATFYRKDIRKAVSSTGIRSEASQRFEKGQNPENSINAVYRFADLLKESNPDLRIGKVEHLAVEDFKQNKITTSISYILKRLGNVKINSNKIIEILSSLGMKCIVNGDNLEVHVPVYRSYFDIEIPDDLVEEIGRIIGYNQITPEPILVSCKVPDFQNKLRAYEHQLRNLMSHSYQFSEVYNYAFQGAGDIEADSRYCIHQNSKAVKMKNPINKELEFLRISPLPGLLKNIAENHKRFSDLRFFELERIFLPNDGKQDEKSLPVEKYFLAGIMQTDLSSDDNLSTLLTMVTDILVNSGFHYYDLIRQQLVEPVFHPGRAGQIKWKNKDLKEIVLVKWGEVHPKLVNQYDILKRIYYFEMFTDEILECKTQIEKKSHSNYIPVHRYPASEFEFTVVTDVKTNFATILDVIGIPKPTNLDTDVKTTLESVEHLTTYIGEAIPNGKKAVSIKVRWRNRARTMEHEEIKTLQEKLVTDLAKAGLGLR